MGMKAIYPQLSRVIEMQDSEHSPGFSEFAPSIDHIGLHAQQGSIHRHKYIRCKFWNKFVSSNLKNP